MKKFTEREMMRNQTSEMGLFTFYKEQQLQEDAQERLLLKFKPGLKQSNSQSKGGLICKEKSNVSRPSRDRVNGLKQSADCDQFLKNIRLKQQKKKHDLTNRHREALKNSKKQGQESAIHESFIESEKRQSMSLFLGHKSKADPTLNNISFSLLKQPKDESDLPISAENIRKKYFNSERCSIDNHHLAQTQHRQITRSRLEDQMQRNEGRLKKKYTQEEIIKPKVYLIHQERRNTHIKTRFREFRQKLESFKKTKEISPLKRMSNVKELQENNKKYFNQIMENMNVQPECNQTVYRILRDTLKFPHFAKEHLKTQGNTPEPDHLLNQSTFKPYPQNSIVSMKKRSLQQGGSLKLGIGTRVISRRVTQK